MIGSPIEGGERNELYVLDGCKLYKQRDNELVQFGSPVA